MIQILPTDTCYGLSGDFNKEDYLGIYSLKGRDFSRPLAFLVRDFDDLDNYINLSKEQKEYLRNYPHPWSILGVRKDTYTLPSFLNQEQYSKISLRVAKKCILESVSNTLVFPLFLTSANISGQSESSTLAMAQNIFPGVVGQDGGLCNNPPSDIFSFGESNELIFLRKNSQ
ncbi:Sua5/YciO/YrdC/YwlC family protein [Candidatus Gracilibacteria bacterium]|nr:Sua5/YciO/YrdC/YwlC family protein [Candidatus Gracilibacteria bacterium]